MNKQSKIISVFLVIFIITILAGCAQTKPASTPDNIMVVDDLGKEVKLKEPAKRIISLYTGHTENLYSLGLNDEIIGVSDSESFPPSALKKQSFSYREDAEKLIAAKPDLVLIRTFIANNYPDFVNKLETAGIPVAVLYPENVDQFLQYLKKLGKLTGKEKEAGELVDQFNSQLKKIGDVVAKIPQQERKKVFFETTKDITTCTPDSIAAFILEKAGAINVAIDAKAVRPGSTIASYGQERLLAKARDIDVYLVQKGEMNKTREEEIYLRPGYQAIKAIQNHQVFLVPEALVSRPTMRLLDGIAEIGRVLYPDYFKTV
ncbi:periplasmic binding protein [Desulfofarcimen acetoxidans DSM 771]|uniref:Periplasmic binding protein n=1 Tax=Desulfofarcimen acetoxidans (strain ATCC 49208 / DSM 771 / KCTC 5769 / VKM B-1644 / 5575) TaxID=485916 RepID=C8W620_DESAS|nr:ABC transporter substrate-binding protein [Desulfofarcimen acetoxidans]ACV61475.1 periplasmic binding protein [Desulfofarcimen acetoxidans DSM 771]